ncbi:MAG: molecular chaperone DnaJ [Actinomycetota bacterium]
MAPVRDLYEILGVRRDATDDDIRKAYRRLAREHHPDVNGEPAAEARFKEVAGAYEILSDPEKRARYDTFGSANGPSTAGFTDISEIFEMFFGGGFGGFAGGSRRRGPRGRAQRGEDLAVRMRLGFHDAAFGLRREAEIERLAVCATCLGNGAQPGTAPVGCRACGGSGEVQSARRSVFGTLMTSAPCPTCAGSGEEIPDKCETCSGAGRVREISTTTLEIPAGVSDGMELRVGGSGHAGIAGGPAGDLFVRLDVEPPADFERRNQDLHTVLDVSITQATLGAEIVIPGIEGHETIHVEPGTPSGAVVRMKGRGIPNLQRRGRGDLFVTLHVVAPTELSREERKLLEQLADLRGEPRKGAVEGTIRRPGY